jgi:hypothetical protein
LLRKLATARRPVRIDPADRCGVVEHGTTLAFVLEEPDPAASVRSLMDSNSHAESGSMPCEVLDLVG